MAKILCECTRVVVFSFTMNRNHACERYEEIRGWSCTYIYIYFFFSLVLSKFDKVSLLL